MDLPNTVLANQGMVLSISSRSSLPELFPSTNRAHWRHPGPASAIILSFFPPSPGGKSFPECFYQEKSLSCQAALKNEITRGNNKFGAGTVENKA